MEFLSPENIKRLWNSFTDGHAVVVTLIVVLVLFALRMTVLRITYRNIDDKFARLRYKRSISYFIVVIGLMLLLPVWLPSIRNIATFLGIFGAGFIIVTRDLWVCVAGSMYIMIRRPYMIGDRIQIGNLNGDVVDIRLMETSVMEVSSVEGGASTGRLIYFPNSKIFTETIAVTSKSIAHVFQEIQVRLDAASDWESAAKILEKSARQRYEAAIAMREQMMDNEDKTDLISGYREPRVTTEIHEGTILLRLQFMAPAGQVAGMRDSVSRLFLAAMRKQKNIRITKV